MFARNRNIPSLLAVALVVALVSLSFSGSIVNAAPASIDQQCSAIGGSYLDGVGVHQPAGQTFIPTQSSLVGFSLHLWSENPNPTSMTANVISNGLAGVNGVQGTLIGSVTFDVPANFGQPTGDWLNVQLPSGIALTPGAVYALDLKDNSGSGGIKWSSCSAPYANGCGYANGQCEAVSWAFIENNGDFSVAFSTSGISIAQGASGNLNLYVTSLNDFASPVAVTFSGPPGVTASFNGPSEIDTSAGGTSSPTVTIDVSGTVAAGTYPFTVTASSGAISHSATLQLTVTPSSTVVVSSPNPDFLAQPSPTTITLTPDSAIATTIVLSSVNGFSSSVDLGASWSGNAPSGVTLTLPSPVTVPAEGSVSSVLTLSASTSPSTGSYTLVVTATNGVISHSTLIQVTIAGTPSVPAPVSIPDFTINPSSATVSVIQGLSTSTSVIVNSVGSFSSPVTISASWVGSTPTGIGIIIPQPVTPLPNGVASSSLEFTTTSTGSTGIFILQLIGTSGPITHTTQITLQVNTPGPQCIIATATYGSNVAPQVQLLRNFRDNSILRTKAGTSFMLAFNSWYYSFSPPVANYIANHWVERTAMQGILYPLIGILGISYRTFQVADAFPELAIVLAGVMASGMIGAVYLGLPLGVLRARFKRFRGSDLGRSLERMLAAACITSGVALAIGEMTSVSTVLMMSSAALVLSTMTLASIATSNRVAKTIAGGRAN